MDRGGNGRFRVGSARHRRSGVQDLGDFLDQILQMKRLREHPRIFRRLVLAVERDGGKAGDEHDLEIRIQLGRAARQKLVRLPDGSALMLTHLLYLTPASVAIHEKGLTPDVAVEQPDVDFGQPAPAKDATLDKAIEQLTLKAAA